MINFFAPPPEDTFSAQYREMMERYKPKQRREKHSVTGEGLATLIIYDDAVNGIQDVCGRVDSIVELCRAVEEGRIKNVRVYDPPSKRDVMLDIELGVWVPGAHRPQCEGK